MKKILAVSFLFCCLVITFSCKKSSVSDLEMIEVKDDSGKVTEKFSRRKSTGVKEGQAIKYYDDGRILEVANYVAGKLEGKRDLYYETGQLQFEENYKMGEFVGPYQAYYEDGKLELKGVYLNGKMSEEWHRFYKNGQLMERVTFVNNDENGPFVEYHENGKLKAEGSYLDGDNEHGPLNLYGKNGELIRKMNCEKGICRTTWKSGDPENE